ncbi:MAG: hypothetical protein IPJ65_12855 [Archangiaceae bacterium]|nr:hypothetical protein [Archangiaceae bacterium]
MTNLKNAMLVGLTMAASQSWAQAALTADQAERCATRLSISITGKSPTSALMSSGTPQTETNNLVASADFQERFSRFINASFNDDPAPTAVEDAAYYMAKYVLANNLKWSDMFVGQFKVDQAQGATNPSVTADTNGLGFFRSPAWLKAYAGNEEAGIKIRTAFRIMNNTIGLKLIPSTNAPGADVSANGRQSAGCRACHYDSWFALDHAASILTIKKTDNNGNITFAAPLSTSADILGFNGVTDDKDFVTRLVNSEAFEFRACRIAFEYLYGRPELTCEGPVFDKCMTAFKADGKIQSAIVAVAQDASFCQ